MTRAEVAERIAQNVHDEWARNPSRAGVLPALKAVAMRVREIPEPPIVLPTQPFGPHQVLTPAQHRVLQIVATGATNADTAQVLGVSEKTVKTHLLAVVNKLGATSRIGAVVLAHRWGLVDLGGAG